MNHGCSKFKEFTASYIWVDIRNITIVLVMNPVSNVMVDFEYSRKTKQYCNTLDILYLLKRQSTLHSHISQNISIHNKALNNNSAIVTS